MTSFPSSSPAAPPGMACPGCGWLEPVGAKECRSCGAPLGVGPSAPSAYGAGPPEVSPMPPAKGIARPGSRPAASRPAERNLQPATKKLLWGLVVAALLVWQSFSGRPVRHPAGMLIPEEPEQTALPPGKTAWMVGEDRIQPLATYRIKARVLHTERYRWDAMSDLSPLDLGVGWRVMSDETWATQSDFSNTSRYLSWQSDASDFPGEAAVCISNMHLLPASDRVRDRLLGLRRGELVQLSGYLVEVQRPGMNPWTSSLSRLDSGDGACEIMWVEAAAPLDRRPSPGKTHLPKN